MVCVSSSMSNIFCIPYEEKSYKPSCVAYLYLYLQCAPFLLLLLHTSFANAHNERPQSDNDWIYFGKEFYAVFAVFVSTKHTTKYKNMWCVILCAYCTQQTHSYGISLICKFIFLYSRWNFCVVWNSNENIFDINFVSSMRKAKALLSLIPYECVHCPTNNFRPIRIFFIE